MAGDELDDTKSGGEESLETSSDRTDHTKTESRDALREISDRSTFRSVSDDPRMIAGLYFYSVLDPLFDLARSVGHDFFRRPDLYTKVKRNTANYMAQLATLSGTHPVCMDATQRAEIYAPILGGGSGSARAGGFQVLRDALTSAARAVVESTPVSGIDSLNQVVREAHERFKNFLDSFYGSSLRWSKEEALDELAEPIAYSILRDDGTAAVFGVSAGPANEWPYFQDPDGDKLVEQIGIGLVQRDTGVPRLSKDGFASLQRIAIKGAEALAVVIEFKRGMSDDDLEVLVRRSYGWARALDSSPMDGQSAPLGASQARPRPASLTR